MNSIQLTTVTAKMGNDDKIPLWGTILIGITGLICLICCIVFACLRCYEKKKQKSASRADLLKFKDMSDDDKAFATESVQPQLEKKSYGSMKVCLHYTQDDQKLNVGVQECVNLPVADFATQRSDPYVKVFLSPDMKPMYQTKCIKKTLNPHFNENFVFDVDYSKIGKKSVVLGVYDHDVVSSDDKIAQLRIPLASVDLSAVTEEWYDLEAPCKDADLQHEDDLGQVCISLRFVPAASQLKVVVVEARNIAQHQVTTSEVYFKLSIFVNDRRVTKKRTSLKKETVNPYFNEAFTFSMTPEQARLITLVVVLSEYTTLGKSKSIGWVELGYKSTLMGSAHWQNAMLNQRHPVAQWHSLHN
jgi:hypothetical protein